MRAACAFLVAAFAIATPLDAQEVSAFGVAGSSSINGLGDHYGGGLSIALFRRAVRNETDSQATNSSRGRVGLRAAFSLLTAGAGSRIIFPPCPESGCVFQSRGPRRIVAQHLALILRSPDTRDFRLDLGLGPNFYVVQGEPGIKWGMLLTGGVGLRVAGPTWLLLSYDFHGDPGAADVENARRPYATHMLRAGLSVDLRRRK